MARHFAAGGVDLLGLTFAVHFLKEERRVGQHNTESVDRPVLAVIEQFAEACPDMTIPTS
jgi:hypothetical protein